VLSRQTGEKKYILKYVWRRVNLGSYSVVSQDIRPIYPNLSPGLTFSWEKLFRVLLYNNMPAQCIHIYKVIQQLCFHNTEFELYKLQEYYIIVDFITIWSSFPTCLFILANSRNTLLNKKRFSLCFMFIDLIH